MNPFREVYDSNFSDFGQDNSNGLNLEDPDVVNAIHRFSDLDLSSVAQHHSLGLGENQAAKGTHIHSGTFYTEITTASTLSAVVEIKDTVPDLIFTALLNHKYEIIYFGEKFATNAGGMTMDFNIRDGGSGSPGIASTKLAFSTQDAIATRQILTRRIVICPGDIAAGIHTLGGFYIRTAGAGGGQFQNGTRRQLSITDLGL